ncbi:unnamed protein product [Auanema sp. JU1783]|nr:unnamed protein product [Auanema sp. JU1783]
MFDGCYDEPIPPVPTTPIQVAHKLPAEEMKSAESPTRYTFDDFPITKRETLNVSNYKLDLVYAKRTLGLAVRLKKGDCIRSSLLNDLATEKEIRAAARALEEEVLNPGKNFVNKESVPFLNKHFIVTMEKESLLFPEAIYYCELCSFHMNNINQAKSHVEQYATHLDGEERFQQRKNLFNSLPKPSNNHLEALNTLILHEVGEGRIKTSSNLQPNNLQSFVKEKTESLTIMLQKIIPDKLVTLTNYGSVLTDCDTCHSNVNYLLNVENCNISESFVILSKFYNGLQSHQKQTNEISNIVLSDSMPPNISFVMNNVEVVLSWKNDEHVETSKLIKIFSGVCANLSVILRFVRRWASISGLDNSNKKGCGFCSFVFDYMVIHFLQKEGFVPHLKDIFAGYVNEDSEENFATSYLPHFDALFADIADSNKLNALRKRLKVPEKWNYADLFLKFLKYTIENKTDVVQIVSKTPILRKSTKLKVSVLQVQDPYGENIASCSKAFQCYFLNCFLISYVYFSIPQNSDGPLTKINFYQKLVESPRKKKTKEKDSQFQKVQLKLKENETPEKTKAVRTLAGHSTEPQSVKPNKSPADEDEEIERLTKELEKLQQSAKVIPITQEECIEFNGPNQYPKKAMLDINSSSTYQLTTEVMKIIRAQKLLTTKKKPLRPGLILLNPESMQSPELVNFYNRKKINWKDEIIQDRIEPITPGNDAVDAAAENLNSDNVCFEEFFMEYDLAGIKSIKEKVKSWTASDYRYVFLDSHNFNKDFCPELKCTFCDKLNHSTAHCHRTKTPALTPYPKKDSNGLFELDTLIMFNHGREKLSDSSQKNSADAVQHLANILSDFFRRKVKLEIFGSLVNGFGTKGSDLDVCFTFANSPAAPPEIDPKNVIKQIYKALISRHKFVSNITRILMAKVPIVKFVYHYHGLEYHTDISYYNCLAIHNSKLLRTYCLYEPVRLPQLGLWVKKFAKVCDIGDASKGSLSSYSYIIMLIHYLQNCEPPVLPRLQEDFKTDSTPQKIIEGWDVYFHDKITKKKSKNTMKVSELFLGFLDYFSSFNYYHKVIQIRRKEELLKMEKRWNRPICIEDPFDLKHNLGNVVNSKMFLFIRQCFISARDIFNSEETRLAFCLRMGRHPMDIIQPHEIPAYMEFSLDACDFGNAPSVRYYRSRAGNNNTEEHNKQTPKRQTQEDAGQTNVKERKNQTSTPNRRRNKKSYNRPALNPNQNGTTQVASPRA